MEFQRCGLRSICPSKDAPREALAEVDGGIILKLVEAIVGVGRVGKVGSDRPYPVTSAKTG